MEQPTAKISDELLNKLIQREFPNNITQVRLKLNRIISDSQGGKNRFSAAVLKLADRDFTKLDELIEECNYDFRDIVSKAEYPQCFSNGFQDISSNDDEIYRLDWKQYSNWLTKTD